MAWIESHQTLRDHPKLKRLARRLEIPEVQAIGHLHCLWWWAMDYAPDGDVSKYDELDLALAAAWIAKPEPFVLALKECGWLTDGHAIHDWHDYCGKLIERKERNRAAQQRARQRDKAMTSPDVTVTSRTRHDDVTMTSDDVMVTSRPTVPNLTKPNQTVPDQRESAPTAVDAARAEVPPAPERSIRPVPKPRATRLPADFEPDEQQVEFVTERLGMTTAQVLNETDKFRDHFTANGKTMTDWQAAWRNWMRRSTEFAPRTPRPASGRAPVANPFTAIREQREATSASFDDAIDVEYAER